MEKIVKGKLWTNADMSECYPKVLTNESFKYYKQQLNFTNKMEKQNFKHKLENVVISEDCLSKVPQPEKDKFQRSSEIPNHTVESKEGKNFFQPIISASETKTENVKQNSKKTKTNIIAIK